MCDDVEFVVDQNRITSDVNCTVAQSFLKNTNRFLGAAATNPSDFPTLARTLTAHLQSADAPLIVGLNHLTTEAQQLAWRIADVCGARIDTTLAKNNRASIYCLQQIGKVTASLGEIANRSDMVVFWFSDPQKTHPRLIERLSRTKAAAPKRIIVVGDSSSATAEVADEVFEVRAADAADFVTDVRRAIRPNQTDTAPSTSKDARQLAQLLTASKYGSWIYGHTDLPGETDDITIASQTLVRELNDHTRFVSLALRNDQNGASGENVLAASSGFPAAVDLSMSIPQYNGPEHAAETVLENGECDFVLLFAGRGTLGELDNLSPSARARFAKTPKALITSEVALALDAELVVHVDRPGVSDSGEWCRVDDISMAAERMVAGNFGSTADLLELVFARLCSD